MAESIRQPSFSGIRSFMGAPTALENNVVPDVSIVGVPFDDGTTNRPGARFGPSALREASMFFYDDWHPYFRVNPSDSLKMVDMGDVDIINGDINESLVFIEEQIDNIKTNQLLTLGGDHTCTLPILRSLRKKYDEPMSIIHFDAHVDTWKDEENDNIDHGTPFHHAAQEGLIDPATSIQIGIRAPTPPDILDYTSDLGFHTVTAEAVHMGTPISVADDILKATKGKNVYLTFDIDCIDPSQAPGTGTPEIGGLFTWQVLAILQRLEDINFIGMDLVEVAPMYDCAQITSLAGATFLWTYLCILAKKKQTSK